MYYTCYHFQRTVSTKPKQIIFKYRIKCRNERIKTAQVAKKKDLYWKIIDS